MNKIDELNVLSSCVEELKSKLRNKTMTDDDIYAEICVLEDITAGIRIELEPQEERFIKDKNEMTIDREDYEKIIQMLEKYQEYISRLIKASQDLISFNKENRSAFTVILGGKQ